MQTLIRNNANIGDAGCIGRQMKDQTAGFVCNLGSVIRSFINLSFDFFKRSLVKDHSFIRPQSKS